MRVGHASAKRPWRRPSGRNSLRRLRSLELDCISLFSLISSAYIGYVWASMSYYVWILKDLFVENTFAVSFERRLLRKFLCSRAFDQHKDVLLVSSSRFYKTQMRPLRRRGREPNSKLVTQRNIKLFKCIAKFTLSSKCINLTPACILLLALYYLKEGTEDIECSVNAQCNTSDLIINPVGWPTFTINIWGHTWGSNTRPWGSYSKEFRVYGFGVLLRRFYWSWKL